LGALKVGKFCVRGALTESSVKALKHAATCHDARRRASIGGPPFSPSSFVGSFMKFTAPIAFVLIAPLVSLGACSDDSEPSHVLPEVPAFDSGLDPEKMLNTLTDEEIEGACELLEETLIAADTNVACQVESTATTDDVDACLSARTECLASPRSARDVVEASPLEAEVDCGVFAAELTADCPHPVSALEDCINAIAVSVEPSIEATQCEQAGELSELSEVDSLAKSSSDISYVSVCAPLIVCEKLITALLGGDDEADGMGGAGGAAN